MEYGKINLGETLITLLEDAYPTSRAFPGCFNDAQTGEVYVDEYRAKGKNSCGDIVRVTWQFLQIKGSETDPENLPWESKDHVYSVDILEYAHERLPEDEWKWRADQDHI